MDYKNKCKFFNFFIYIFPASLCFINFFHKVRNIAGRGSDGGGLDGGAVGVCLVVELGFNKFNT